MQSILNEEGFFDTIKKAAQTLNSFDSNVRKGVKDNTIANKPYYMGGSISRYAKNLIMSFPVLCDDSIDIEILQMVSKANEKNITNMLQMLFASMSLNAKDIEGVSGADWIRVFHRNIDSSSIDDIIDYTNDFISARENAYTPKMSNSEYRQIVREITESLKIKQKSFPVNNFSENGLENLLVRKAGNTTLVYEARPPYDPQYDVSDREKYQHQMDIEDRGTAYQRQRDEYQRLRDTQRDLAQTQNDAQRRRDDLYTQNYNVNRGRVLDNEFKKANELQPTTLMINFNVMSDDGSAVVDRRSFVAGVKCRMIPTSAMDIIERLAATNKTKLSFKELIRATTGETKLMKDFVLAVNQQKLDAKNDVKKGEAAKLWATLKKRSAGNAARKCMKDKNDASAITTLVISQNTVDYLKNNYKMDLLDTKNAKYIMDSYNLLCLVVVDDTNEVASFLYDGNNSYEMVAFSALERGQRSDKTITSVNYIR